MLQIWIIVITALCVTAVASQRRERCGPRRMGVCKVAWYCPQVWGLLARGRNLHMCGFNRNDEPVVCCPSEHHHDNEPIRRPSSRISEKKCEEYEKNSCQATFQVAVVGGVTVKPKELPFMGLVGYGTKDEIDWACGCSLISEKFVMSAAHCTSHPSSGFANWVRLGELDLDSEADTASPEDFRIVRRINHPEYRSRFVYNDIALFELDRTITDFTSFIKPICLPRRSSFENTKTVVGAGWGTTDIAGPRSAKLMKVNLDLYNLNECEETASDRGRVPQGLNERTMLCAGSLEGGRDTCSGDSGGPLFLPRDESKHHCSLFTQLGITSFGKLCAVKGLPGVYTNILPYVPWIESVVWQDNDSETGAVWDS